jgi:transcriptional regulator with XRE-family HTH domain
MSLSLRETRLVKGLTLKQASSMIGSHPNTLSNWENGITKLPEYAKNRICEVYNVKENEIKWDLQ